MDVRAAMVPPEVRLTPDSSLLEAARLFASSDASDVMVTDEDGRFVGTLSEGDLIRAILPDIDEIRDAGGSVQDANAAFVRKAAALAGNGIERYLIRDPLTLAPGDHLARAAVVMVDRQIRRLPVVDEAGMLVGVLSRGNLCRAAFQTAL